MYVSAMAANWARVVGCQLFGRGVVSCWVYITNHDGGGVLPLEKDTSQTESNVHGRYEGVGVCRPVRLGLVALNGGNGMTDEW